MAEPPPNPRQKPHLRSSRRLQALRRHPCPRQPHNAWRPLSRLRAVNHRLQVATSHLQRWLNRLPRSRPNCSPGQWGTSSAWSPNRQQALRPTSQPLWVTRQRPARRALPAPRPRVGRRPRLSSLPHQAPQWRRGPLPPQPRHRFLLHQPLRLPGPQPPQRRPSSDWPVTAPLRVRQHSLPNRHRGLPRRAR